MTDKKKPQPIDVNTIDMEKMKELTTDLPGLMEYAHSVGGFQIVPTQEGAIKGKALKAMHQQTNMQLGKLYEQMKLMAKQVQEIKDRTQISEVIYQSHIRFEPVIGDSYFLYSKKGKTHLSLIAPDEWGSHSQYEYLAHVKLLADHTWDILDCRENWTDFL